MLAHQITEAFVQRTLNFDSRCTPPQGWPALPEIQAAEQKAGRSDVGVRLFCTFTCAMDRARESAALWQSATQVLLNQQTNWIFDPAEVARNRGQVTRLQQYRISQRHGPDADAWHRIGVALTDPNAPPAVAAVQAAVMQGNGNAGHLLAVVQERHQGVALFPLLRGPKIRAMWLRMLVYPGGAANISNLAALPVAVDTHVHRVTYYLQMPPYNVAHHPPYIDGGRIPGHLRLAIGDGWQHSRVPGLGEHRGCSRPCALVRRKAGLQGVSRPRTLDSNPFAGVL
jgi:hypothetical protein